MLRQLNNEINNESLLKSEVYFKVGFTQSCKQIKHVWIPNCNTDCMKKLSFQNLHLAPLSAILHNCLFSICLLMTLEWDQEGTPSHQGSHEVMGVVPDELICTLFLSRLPGRLLWTFLRRHVSLGRTLISRNLQKDGQGSAGTCSPSTPIWIEQISLEYHEYLL